MTNNIDELINFTQSKLGLERYFLKRHQLYEKANLFNEITYTLAMEWFPEHCRKWEDDELNPDGTAVIEFDIQERKLVSVVFVGDKTFVDQPLLESITKNNVVQWLEQETELTYGEQFLLKDEKKHEFFFEASFHGVSIYPPGHIDIKFDPTGKLVHYSIYGHFLKKTLINVEKFTLTLEQIEQIIYTQLKLIKFPDDEKKQLHAIYGIEEVFITNDGLSTINFDVFAEERQVVKVNKVFEWQSPLENNFTNEELYLSDEVPIEQDLFLEHKKMIKEITKDEQDKSFLAVRDFLRQQYCSDSGKWRLTKLYRENTYIVAIIRPVKESNFIIQRKITVFIDQDSFKVVNFFDNNVMLDIFNDYEQPDKPQVTKETAYEKLLDHITLEPVYVFHAEKEKCVLCGKLDCSYGIDALTGERINLDQL